jgi:hypothetical protein
VEAQKRVAGGLGSGHPERDAAAVVLRHSRARSCEGAPPPDPHALWPGLARQMPQVADARVGPVVLPPSFLDVVDCVADRWLRCWFAGVDSSAATVVWIRGEHAWTTMVRRVFAEKDRAMRPGGWIAFEVGKVRDGGATVRAPGMEGSGRAGVRPAGVLVNRQDFTNTANCWGVSNGARGGGRTAIGS